MQVITTTFKGPTNCRGARIIAKCDAGTITVPYDYSDGHEDNHKAAAMQLAEQLDWVHGMALVSGSLPQSNPAGYAHVLVRKA